MNRHYLSIVAIAVSCLYCGCAGGDRLKRVYVYGYDFTKYTAVGFLFTPEKYLGEYESIGMLVVEIYPEIKKEKKTSMQYGTSDYDKPQGWHYYPISTGEALDSLYSIATKMGADAVVNLVIEDAEEKWGVLNDSTIPGKKVSGFAVKRKLRIKN